MEQRFKEDVTRKPHSFFQLDLGPLLDQYIEVLAAVRAPFNNSAVPSPIAESSHRSATSQLTKATEEGDGISSSSWEELEREYVA